MPCLRVVKFILFSNEFLTGYLHKWSIMITEEDRFGFGAELPRRIYPLFIGGRMSAGPLFPKRLGILISQLIV